jgi:hypothetical protein
MEITRSILEANFSNRAYLGKTKQECHVIDLKINNGIIEWVIVSQELVPFSDRPLGQISEKGTKKKLIGKEKESKKEPSPKFFDSFFVFSDLIWEINDACSKFIGAYGFVMKLKQIVEVIKTAYPTNKFVLSYDVEFKLTENFTSGSFVRYLQQVLVLNWDALGKAEKAINYFLTNSKLATSQELLTLDVEELKKRIIEFNYKYKEHWVPLLTQHYQPQDENTILGSIRLGDRCQVPHLAAHLYLQDREKR